MTGLLYYIYITCLMVIQCGRATGRFVSQLESTVKVQPGLSTSLECHAQIAGRLSIFWMKLPLNKAPVCIATAKGFAEVTMCDQFKNHSRITVTWSKKTLNLSISSVDQTDVATYFCGVYSNEQLFFGNGSKLILDERAGAVSLNTPIKENEEKAGKVFEYLVPALAATNVATMFIIIWLCRLSKKNRSGVAVEAKDAGNKTDEVNYAALNFNNKPRRTVQKRTNVDPAVIYGAVRHQEEI